MAGKPLICFAGHEIRVILNSSYKEGETHALANEQAKLQH